MWHTIAEVKGKHKGQSAIIIGPGPSADRLPCTKNKVLIGLTRSIVLLPNFDFIFVDSPQGFQICNRFLSNARFFCMPIWSRGFFNVNSEIAQRNRSKILFFSWVYETPEIINAPDYSLNDFLLHIFWGCAQSALHFCQLIGVKSVEIIGCDGKPINEKMNCAKVEKLFAPVKSRKTRTITDYTKTRAGLERTAKDIGIPVKFLC